MAMIIKPSWVKYKNMGGPRYLGERDDRRRFVNVYNPPKPWGVWSQVLGVIAACEGRYDTVVMYDGTGVTFGFMQWTFTSGRLQRFLEYMKSIPTYDFDLDENEIASTLFDDVLKNKWSQWFDEFGFRIIEGKFCHRVDQGELVGKGWVPLNPANKGDKQAIVNICMGLGSPEDSDPSKAAAKKKAMGLCRLFAEVGRDIGVQAAQIEFAKTELRRALKYTRPPLKDVGGRIECLLPEELWGGPVPAIFFNLYQNSPGGAFKLMKKAMKWCGRHGGMLSFDPKVGFHSIRNPDGVLDVLWDFLSKSKYADWGFGSKQYLSSGKKNPPRIVRIAPAIKKYYGVDLPLEG